MPTANPWSSHRVNFPPPDRGFNNACLPFATVTHVTHLSDAIRIFEDGRIRAGLVYDECKLNSERVTVCWLSPKEWAYGYIYGHIAFEFDWSEIVADNKIRWVEHRRTRNQDICRFLVSSNDYSTSGLNEYPFTTICGPLYRDDSSAKWYHNNLITSEYMVDTDLQLAKVKRIFFVDHHQQWCSKIKWDQGTCPDMSVPSEVIGARLLAWLIGKNRQDIQHLFHHSQIPRRLNGTVSGAISRLRRKLVRAWRDETSPPHSRDWTNLLRVALAAFAAGEDAQLIAVLTLFPDENSLTSTFWALIESYFTGIEIERD